MQSLFLKQLKHICCTPFKDCYTNERSPESLINLIHSIVTDTTASNISNNVSPTTRIS